MSVLYVCAKPGCFNLTKEVWCVKHVIEHEAKKRARAALVAVREEKE